MFRVDIEICFCRKGNDFKKNLGTLGVLWDRFFEELGYFGGTLDPKK